jgi:dTDP-4-amino-4,6-dideoxygalactose transaminase
MNVPFVDLPRQYATIKPVVDRAIAAVVESGQFVLGAQGAALETEMARYCGVAHAIGVGSGTDALRLALQALGLRPADEVITTPFTFVASVVTIAQAGAVPVFADIDPVTFALDPGAVARKITSRTRAIMPVHLYGQPADMAPLLALARDHGLSLIEDAAQAVGAEYQGRRVGGIGDVACFSFFPTKNLGAYGDAGLVTTSDAALAERLRMLRHHGSRDRYVHEFEGWCSRLDEIQAAVLRVKLGHLEAWTERRRAIAAFYRRGLAGLPIALPPERSNERAVYHLFTIRSSERDDLAKHLADRGIRTAVHYPTPVHQQPLYRTRYREALPESERASREVLSLPLFPEITPDELDAVVAGVTSFFDA